jgi:hypothetical protein
VARVGCAGGVLHDGSLIVAGGDKLDDGGIVSDCVERYDPGRSVCTAPAQGAPCKGGAACHPVCHTPSLSTITGSHRLPPAAPCTV